MVQVVSPAANRPVDPNTVIPPAVAANAAAAHALQEQFIKAREEANSETPSEGFGASDEPKSDPQPELPGIPAKTPPAPPAGDDESWQNRFHALKGRFDRQGDQVKGLSDQIASMQRVIDQLSMQPRPQAPVTPEVKRLLTDEEVSDFGPEFLDVVGRRAEEIFAPRAQAYEAKINQLEAQLQGVGGFVQRTGRQEMMDQLDQDVPGWRDVNLSDEFKSWLALPDPFTGAIRHEQLKAAWDRNAVSQARAFFKGFLAEEAATAPARGSPAPGPRSRNNGSPRPNLEDFAAPGRAKSAATGTVPAEKPVYTRPEITKFYTDIAAGRWRGRDEERKRIDADIQLAGIEGRVS